MTVLPSTYRSEAFGLVQLQAHACARPVVSTDLPGVSMVNVDGLTGLTISQRSAKALSNALSKLLVDKALCQKMGEAALQQVTKNYQASTMAERTEDLYMKVMAG